jgi:glucan phosphorylase
VLYGVVRTHLTEFLAAVDAQTDGSGVPAFVVKEFRKFLLPHGWLARVKASMARLVPRFSADRMVRDYLTTLYARPDDAGTE